MFTSAPSLNRSLQDIHQVKDGFHEILRKFWQFCEFYGEYNVTPIHQRRTMVEEYIKLNP